MLSLARLTDCGCGWKARFVIQQQEGGREGGLGISIEDDAVVLHRIISASGGDWKTMTVSSHLTSPGNELTLNIEHCTTPAMYIFVLIRPGGGGRHNEFQAE